MEQVFQAEMTFILVMEHEPGRGRWSCALLQLCPEALAQKPLLCDVWGEMESKGHSMETRWTSIYIRETWFTTIPAR